MKYFNVGVKKNTKNNIFGLLILLMLISSCSDSSQREAETFIIEEGYIGSFHIIHGIRNGQKRNENNGARIYEIPKNGILVTQMTENQGSIEGGKIKFYYRNSNNELSKITDHWTTSLKDNPENRADKKIRIFGGSFGELESIYVDCKLLTQSFYVGTKENVLEGTNFFEMIDFLKNNKIDCTGLETSSISKQN